MCANLNRCREPYNQLEVHTMVSFICDNPQLPVKSRAMWSHFTRETGCKRAYTEILRSLSSSFHETLNAIRDMQPPQQVQVHVQSTLEVAAIESSLPLTPATLASADEETLSSATLSILSRCQMTAQDYIPADRRAGCFANLPGPSHK